MSMAGKKENCGCGCIGQKPTNTKTPKNKKKPKKSS
jgi:hypothetical protein